MAANPIPSNGNRTTLADSVKHLLLSGPTASLHLGGVEAYSEERRHHTETLGWHNLSEEAKAQVSISEVEFTALRTEHGTISVRVFYPKSGEQYRKSGDAGALVYMYYAWRSAYHPCGYTVRCVDDFEHGLRTLAEASACQVYAVEYHLAPEYRYPTQLDEFSAVINWLQGPEGKKRGIHPDRLAGGGDSAGGNMTAALALRRRDEGLKNMLHSYLCIRRPACRLIPRPARRTIWDSISRPTGCFPLRITTCRAVSPRRPLTCHRECRTFLPWNGSRLLWYLRTVLVPCVTWGSSMQASYRRPATGRIMPTLPMVSCSSVLGARIAWTQQRI